MSEHEHAWTLQIHVDGCHFYGSTYSCACGARRTSRNERDVKNSPYSAVWMNEADDCKRCAELLAGAAPKHTDEIEVPK